MFIEVISKTPRSEGKVIYIGRPSVLGNPFVMRHESDRVTVVEQYRRWLWERIKEKGPVYLELYRIALLYNQGREDIFLRCFCAPKACHGDEVKKAVLWLAQQIKSSLQTTKNL